MESINRYNELNRSIYKLLHEIKNPLTVVSGYLELMEDGSSNNQKFYKIIDEEIKRTLSIISDYSSNKKLEKEEIELSCFMEDIKNTLEELYQNNNTSIYINGEEEIYINTNYDKLKQILINIIKNSYEAKSKNKLEININWYQDKTSTTIIIKDNGVGMTKEELSRLGEEFYTTKEYGTGLGISLIKEMVKLLDGKIKYNSKKGVGTTVTLIFPN